MNPKIVIRNETHDDVCAITEVTIAAFKTLEVSNHTEQFIIEALRAAKALTVSLVAEMDGRVIGHIAFSPVIISDGTPSWYGLGPVSVLPEHQRKGIGKALIKEGLSRLKDMNAQGCCLVGHPDYYRKFGFKNMSGLVHEGVPQEVFFALPFGGHTPQGTVAFHEGFKADGQQEGKATLHSAPDPWALGRSEPAKKSVNEFIVSSTALATSLMRAVHTRLDPDPLINDPWGERLVPEWFCEGFRQFVLAKMDSDERAKALASPESILDDALRANAAYAGVIIRARYTEDALRAAVANGICQYVIIGAGFDSFALRRPAFARELDVYEIDHSATQGLKCQRLRECGLSLPGPVHFIEADLAEEDLGTALARSPFRSNHPAFFSWLGVAVYLTREANLATLRAIATCGASGSELVFTYIDQSEFNSDSNSGSYREVQTDAASVGERWVSGFDPTKIAEDLRRVGLILVEDLDGGQMAERYERTGVNSLRPAATAHIVRARVPG